MKARAKALACALALACIPLAGKAASQTRLQFQNANVEQTSYQGKRAMKVEEKEPTGPSGGGASVVFPGPPFKDGVIEVDVAGLAIKNAATFARGFIGVRFRIQPDDSRFEHIYIRPENGRSPDQVRRNHAVQYAAGPDWGWERLRKEETSKYEAYTDLVLGKWTHLRIVVKGTTASLYVDHAAQPCLVVQDMKNGDSEGSVALWIGPEAQGYFRNLKITRTVNKSQG